MHDAVILSDLHLGSALCQARRIIELLSRIAEGQLRTSRLIVNGDLFDSIDFRRLNASHWKVLSILRSLSKHLEVIWLAGNHDGSAEVVSQLLGVTALDEYVLASGGEKYLVLHGHVFDEFITAHPILTEVADRIYRFLQWIDPSHRFAKMAKHGSKSFLRNAKKIADGARRLARERGCTGAVCGHTHHAVMEEGEVAYFNSGCWTELPCTYLTVHAGAVSLHDFRAAAEARPAESRRLARIVQ